MSTRMLSEIEAAILGVLIGTSPRALYGLEIVKLGGVKRGTVYTTLQRMEGKGFVTSRADVEAPPRRLYRATILGRRAVKARGLAARVMAGRV